MLITRFTAAAGETSTFGPAGILHGRAYRRRGTKAWMLEHYLRGRGRLVDTGEGEEGRGGGERAGEIKD